MARESSLWTWLSKARLTMREHVDLRRVEDMMGAGFPDVDGFAVVGGRPFAFKLELKSEERPARAATKIPFKIKKRTAQIEFMRKRYTMGEAAFFLLQVGEQGDRRLYLAPGDAGEALKAGVNEAELALLCISHGQIFEKNAKPQDVIERIQICWQRRLSRLL